MFEIIYHTIPISSRLVFCDTALNVKKTSLESKNFKILFLEKFVRKRFGKNKEKKKTNPLKMTDIRRQRQ